MDVTTTLSLGGILWNRLRKATAPTCQRSRDSFSLPQPFYCDQHLFEIDMQEIFPQEWLIAGMTCEDSFQGHVPHPRRQEPGPGDPWRRRSQVHAAYNVCRHRGSRLCVSEKGQGWPSWSAPTTSGPTSWMVACCFAGTEMGADFDMKEYGLKPIQVKTAGGYISSAWRRTRRPSTTSWRRSSTGMEPYDMENAKVAVQTTIREAANWKLVIENNRECYHCNGSHPELLKTLLEWDDVTDPRASQAFKRPGGGLHQRLGRREDPVRPCQLRPAQS